MKLIAGVIIVLVCVLGGFVLHHGHLAALFVPTEYLIIGGCLVGAMVIKNPVHTLTGILKDVASTVRGSSVGKARYLELLQMLYQLLTLARRESPLALESHANDPHDSTIISSYRSFTADVHGVAFLCDSLKLYIEGALSPHDMDELMERDLKAIHEEAMEPAEALSTAADSLPAIGIVAAVLGIILTMSAIDEGAATVGRKVAGALVGTFLGVFLAYGFVAPLAGALASRVSARGRYYGCIRQVITASLSGASAATALEVGRRSISPAVRPSFEELEEALRAVKG